MIVAYAFSRPFLLNEQIRASENQTFYKRHILKVIMRVPLTCLIASVLSFIFFQLVGDICCLPFLPRRRSIQKQRFACFQTSTCVIFVVLLLRPVRPVLSSLPVFDFPVLRPVGPRHLPAVHLPVFEVVSRQDRR